MSSADAEVAFAAGWRGGTTLPPAPTAWDLYLLHSGTGYTPHVADGNDANAWKALRTRFEAGATNVGPVVNTAAIVPVFTTTIPGGLLGTLNAVAIRAHMSYTNNSGANAAFTVRIQYGATVVATMQITGIATNADPRTVMVTGLLSAMGSATLQVATGTLDVTQARVHDGTQDAINSFSTQFSQHDACAENSAVDQSLIVSVQHSTANAQLSVIPQAVYAAEQRGT